ncbi:putative receptor-like protein kinase At5g39000 isoform X2 [Rutidosis leptorrhynchoides]|uniref:putative receptor-like protein kinase At5g39000 isoform X2 n=1 Tax=Rutidosis leptorrhynchoides TaxID=125765 RepID=UPI003A99F52D
MLPQHTVDADTNCSIIQPDQTFQCFTLAEIQLATNNFDEKLVIGRGGFGNVYKCTHRLGLVDQVALKRLQTTSNQGAREFEAEIEVLSKLRHANLVSLIGYCSEGNEMVLAYEFMPNGNLQDHLHKNGTNMSWLQRLKICIGAARGLDYLHTGTSTQHGVIHRDVKTSNILLDAKFDAKISDFGLAKIGPINQTKTFVSTLVKGTFGYMDPSYFFSGKLTRKSDVYAFGVVLFEVLSGKQAVDESIDEEQWSLAIWAQDQIKMGKLNQIIEPRLNGQISKKSLKEFANIAAQCFHNQPKKRPTMAEVVVKLDSILLQERNTTVSVGDEVKLYNRLRYLFTGKAELMTVAKGGSKYVSSSAPHDQKSNDQSISIDTLGQKEITLNHPNESTVYQSLDTHLFRQEEGKTSLSWVARLKIALGVAQGLSLLHQRKHYAYLQFKTSLILVDSENNVRLSDSEIENPFLNTGSYDFSKDTSVYAAPEWFRYQADKFDGLPNSYWIEDGITNMAGFGIKSEIYSFGVVLLEILTGLQVYDESRPDEKQNLVKWATPLLSDGENLGMIMDPQLLVNDHPPEGAFKFAKLISKCLQRDQERRPSMKEVLQVLQECYLEETNTADF